MCFRSTTYFIIIMLLVLITKTYAKFEFTNVKCISLNKKFCEYEYCFLKSINRTYKYGSVKMRLNTIPITSMVINIALLKRLNGYKPFLYNITFDGCKVLSNPKSNPVANFFYEFVKPFSNLNHTCPYNHDLIVEKVPVDFVNHRLTNILPFPEGDYLVDSTLIVKGTRCGVLKVYGTLS